MTPTQKKAPNKHYNQPERYQRKLLTAGRHMKESAGPTTSVKSSALETKLPVIWALLLALLTMPYLALSTFARPLADDYCSSAQFHLLGFWQAQANAYNG